MQVFAEVAKHNGFAPAARELGISTSAVSRHIQDLEQWLGTQLLNRTTRQLNLTEAGMGLLSQCKNILYDITELEHTASASQLEPQGKLRITSPEFLTSLLANHVYPSFVEQFPKIELDILITNRVINIIEEGFDIALRSGMLADSNLIARHLIDISLKIVVSPNYELKHGKPDHPQELEKYNCIAVSQSPYIERWPYWEDGEEKIFYAAGILRVNSGRMAKDLAMAGVGVCILPTVLIADAIAEGTLVSWLDEFMNYDSPIYAVYPQNRYISKPVRCFLDHTTSQFQQLKNQLEF